MCQIPWEGKERSLNLAFKSKEERLLILLVAKISYFRLRVSETLHLKKKKKNHLYVSLWIMDLGGGKLKKLCEAHCLCCSVSLAGNSAPTSDPGDRPAGCLWQPYLWVGPGVPVFFIQCCHSCVWNWPWALIAPVSIWRMLSELPSISHLFSCRPLGLQKPPVGWRDGKGAVAKRAAFCICMQTELLTWPSAWFIRWSFPRVSALSIRAAVIRLWLL